MAMQRIAEVLAHPRWPWVAALLGVLLASPALGAGLQLDDHLHRFVVGLHARGEGLGPWWDLYVAAEGDPALTHARMDLGFAPWWTVPDLRVRFFRPLSAATHYVEYALWPDAPGLMHAHGLAWYAALVLSVGALLRRWLGPTWVAGLATLLFAIDDAHATPVSWIAQRNALCSATLTVLALWAHDRARREGWRPGGWLGPGLLALALLAGEASVAVLGYLGAHALWLEPARREGEPAGARVARGLRALGPYAAVVAGWSLLYVTLGYGARGSGIYLDPMGEPGAFLVALPDRAAALALGQWAWPGADAWAGRSAWAVRGGALLVGLGLVLGAIPRLRWDRGLCVAMAGAGLALVPAATAVPDDRLLLLVGVGGSAAVAAVVGVALGEGAERGPRAARGLAGALALPLLAVHLVVAPVSLWRHAGGLGDRLERPQRAAVASLPDDPALAAQTLVIVNAPPSFLSSTLWLWRWGSDRALPRRLAVLGSTFGPVVVQRLDAHTLQLQPVGGYFGDPFTALARGRAHPFAVGDAVVLSEWSVEIIGVARGRPTVVRVRFDRPLGSPELRWVAWRGDRFAPFALPPVGGTLALPGSATAPPG